MRYRVLVPFSLALCTAGLVMAQKPVALKLNPPKGTTILYKITNDTETQTGGMPMPIKIEFAMTSKVGEKTDSTIDLLSTINKVFFSMNAMGQKMEFDSEKPESAANPMAAGMKGLVGKEFTTVMSPKGEVKTIKGFEDLAGPTMHGMDISSNFAQGFAFFPEKPVKPGDTWENTVNNKASGMNFLVKNLWTLTKVEAGIAYMSVKSDVNIDGTPAQAPAGMKMKGIGTQNGVVEVEVATGITMKSSYMQDMKMEMEFNNQPMSMTMKSAGSLVGEKQ